MTTKAWLSAALTAAALLPWLKLLARDGDLARAEAKTLCYRILHAAARLAPRRLGGASSIAATWPWAGDRDRQEADHRPPRAP